VGTWSQIANGDCEKCHYASHSGDVNLWINAGNTSDHPGTPVENTDYFSFARTADDPYIVNQLCLSCHDGTYAGAGSYTSDWQDASQFSLGGTAVDMSSMWSNATTTMYSKYDSSTYNVVPQIQKAYSPHRYPANNTTKGGTHSYTNTIHVGCIECHPSHGSSLKSGQVGDSPWNSYNTDSDLNPTPKGGIMLAAENSNNQQGTLFDGIGNPTYTDETQLCWGCHPDGMDYRGDSITPGNTEWQGSWDNPYYDYKDGGFRSSHFYPNRASMAESWTTTPTGALRTNLTCSTCHDPHGVDSTATYPTYRVPILRGTWLTSPYLEDAVPSTYQTATAFWDWRDSSNNTPTTTEVKGARFNPERAGNRPNTVGWGYANESGNTGVPGYFIDDNTFGVYGGASTKASGQDAGIWYDGTSKQDVYVKHMDSTATSPGGTQSTGSAIVTAYDNVTDMTIGSGLSSNRIAGLCEACHLFDDTTSAGDLGNYTGHKAVVDLDGRSAWNTSWTKMFVRPYMHMKHRYNLDRNDGSAECDWGNPDAQGGTWHDGSCGYRWGVDPNPSRSVQSSYHKFSCSKCHTPHASRLPRLMVTNCLDVGPDQGGYGGMKGDTWLVAGLKHAQGSTYFYPWEDDSGASSSDGEQADTGWFNQGTPPWSPDIAVSCHANDDGAGIWGVGSATFWNSVTPW
jgi:hypothetical protein